jgi:hypothetical protein
MKLGSSLVILILGFSITVLLISLIFVHIPPIPVFTAIFSDAVEIDRNTHNSSLSGLASSDDNVYVIWVDNNGGNAGSILYKVSDDRGKSFSLASGLPRLSGSSPQLAASGNNTYLLWVAANDTQNTNRSNIYLKSSHDNGKSFDPRFTIQKDVFGLSSSQLTASGNNVYVVWVESVPLVLLFEDVNKLKSNQFDTINIANKDWLSLRLVANGSALVDIKQGNKTDWSILSTDFIPVNDNENYVYGLDISARDVNQLNSKVYYYDLNKKQIKEDSIFGGKNGTFIDTFTRILKTPQDSSFVKLQLWVRPNPMKASSYLLSDLFSESDRSSIYVKSSHDKGSDFTNKVDINENIGISTVPHLSASGNTAYVSWIGKFNGTNYPYSSLILNLDNQSMYVKAVRLSLEETRGSSGLYVTSSDSGGYVAWDSNSLSDRVTFIKAVTPYTLPPADETVGVRTSSSDL